MIVKATDVVAILRLAKRLSLAVADVEVVDMGSGEHILIIAVV